MCVVAISSHSRSRFNSFTKISHSLRLLILCCSGYIFGFFHSVLSGGINFSNVCKADSTGWIMQIVRFAFDFIYTKKKNKQNKTCLYAVTAVICCHLRLTVAWCVTVVLWWFGWFFFSVCLFGLQHTWTEFIALLQRKYVNKTLQHKHSFEKENFTAATSNWNAHIFYTNEEFYVFRNDFEGSFDARKRSTVPVTLYCG